MTTHLQRYTLGKEDLLYFLHLPKTGGMTLRNILCKQFDPSAVCPYDRLIDFINIPPDDRTHYQFICGHLLYTVHLFLQRKPIYITMLRDPVERTISHYFHAIRSADHYLHNQVRGKTLLEFLSDPELYPMIVNLQTRHIGLDVDPRTIAATVDEVAQKTLPTVIMIKTLDVPGRVVLERAKQRLSEFAFVGITERFNESLRLLNDTFGWGPVTEYPLLNVASNRLRDEEIPREALELLHEHTQLDRELYQYAQQLFDARLQLSQAEN